MANDLNQIFFTMLEENADKLADDGPTAALCRAPFVNFIDFMRTAPPDQRKWTNVQVEERNTLLGEFTQVNGFLAQVSYHWLKLLRENGIEVTMPNLN
jgi:hypothetical protein